MTKIKVTLEELLDCLPKQIKYDWRHGDFMRGEARGWNDCLDISVLALKRLFKKKAEKEGE